MQPNLQHTIFLSRVALALFVPLLFSGCAPLLSPNIQDHLSCICIARIDDRIGQQMQGRLKNLLQTQKKTPRYRLDITLAEHDRALVLNKQGQNALGHHILKVNYGLVRLFDGCVLAKGVLRLYGIKPLTPSYYSQSVMDHATNNRAVDNACEKLRHIMAIAIKNQPLPPIKNPISQVYSP
jgi:hypothetical protein